MFVYGERLFTTEPQAWSVPWDLPCFHHPPFHRVDVAAARDIYDDPSTAFAFEQQLADLRRHDSALLQVQLAFRVQQTRCYEFSAVATDSGPTDLQTLRDLRVSFSCL
jgi:hypothetical protein